MILDINFIRAPSAIDGVLLYRYRSSYLCAEMISTIREVANNSGRIVDHQDSKMLLRLWNSEGLFPSIKLCELHGQGAQHQFSRLRSLFHERPAELTIIIVKAAKWNSIQHRDLTLIDEPVICVRNISIALEFLASKSKFAAAVELIRDKSFQRYFRNWIEEETAALLPQLAKEFDRAILLYTKPGCSTFVAPSTAGAEFHPRSLMHSALGHCIDDPAPGQMRAVIQSLAWRAERGVSRRTLIDQLVRASSDIVARRCSNTPCSPISIKASPEAALLWAALLASHARAFEAHEEPGLSFSLTIGHLLHEFKSRLPHIHSDPLEERWSDLREVPADNTEDDLGNLMQAPMSELWSVLLAESVKRRNSAWLQKIARLPKTSIEDVTIAHSYLGVDHSEDIGSFNKLVGQQRIVDAIKERFAQSHHDRPLLLAGPPGSGKRTVARLYAKSLLCEGELAEGIGPCGDCVPCQRFASSSLWGYLEFDMSKPNVAYWCRYHIETLQYEPISERRVVILRNVERSDEAIDTFLRTLEKGVKVTTFVLLAESEEAVREAATSRSDRFCLSRLEREAGRELLRRWLPPDRWDAQMLDLITSHGNGRPGVMWHLSQMILSSNTSTFAEALGLFELGSGQRAVDFLFALLEASEGAQRLMLEIDAEPRRTAHCIRAVIYCLMTGGTKMNGIALWGIEPKLKAVTSLIKKRAADLGVAEEFLLDKLAEHWRLDTVTDQISLIESGRRTALLLDDRWASTC